MNERAQRRPTVVVFHCDGGSLATTLAEPVHPGAGFIRVPCAGRVSAGDVLRALRSGATGVLLAGCAPGACRFGDAATHAQNVATDLAPVLEAMGLGAHRVRFAAAGSGAGLTEAVSTFLDRVRHEEVTRPSRAEVSRRSALMNAIPPYPHHGAVQEGALLSQVGRHTSPRPTWARGATAGAKTLLYVCDLPLLGGLLGRHFPGDMHPTLGACMALLIGAGVEVDVVPALPCCGHDFGLAGMEKERVPEARRVREALEATGARRVVTVSSECDGHLREGFGELGVALEPEVLSLVDLLFERLESLTRAFTSPQDPGPGEPTALYVGEGSSESPQSALALLTAAGIEPVAVFPREVGVDGAQGQREDQGSAGVNGFVHCDGAARAAQDRLLHEVEASGASTLITVSVTAAIHLNCALRRGSWRRAGIRVVTLFDALAARLTSTGES